MLKKIQYTRFTDYVPPHTLIEDILNTAYDVVPSKQSTIPYVIHVLGPKNRSKDFLYEATKDDCDHNHQVKAPYVLMFYKRVDDLQARGDGKIKPSYDHNLMIEIGMMSTVITQLCLSKELDVSYTACWLPKDNKIWKDAPVKRPLFSMSIGIGESRAVISRKPRPENKKIFLFK